MGRPESAPQPSPPNGLPDEARVPDPMVLPPVPEGGEMPELSTPPFPELTLPEATEGAMADLPVLPDLPPDNFPDFFA